ncbi:hypothetical protein F5148DRAFT_773530 [Russula earlei]|uniref:Uncharacterized protein n=1 Tax=Russula earlei TaxID=71964 RepID=A0ACC0UC63_9AGAM|nr:hypothetical protein F5148DRAFT_773530 [Russula earlei]
MIMVQKPLHLLSSPSSYHRRHPSAPPTVLVQPTRIPGLLSLSKTSSASPPPRTQQQQQHQNHHSRQSRSSHNRSKLTINPRPPQPPPPAADSPLPSEDLNKLSTPARPTSKSHNLPNLPTTAPEKPPRGRQSSKHKDRSKPRSNSQSVLGKNNNRRNHFQHHQGSPPDPSNLPSQAEVRSKRNKHSSLPSFHSLHTHQHNSFDPFVVSSESDSDNPPSTPTKSILPVRPAPELSSRPTGKLARRRQNISDAPSTPTPSKAMTVPRPQGQLPTRGSHSFNLSRSVPSLSSIKSGELTFPICDDLTDDEDVFAPSTPVHPKSGSVNWQHPSIFDDGPRTAPLTTPRSGFPFNAKPTLTPTQERKRQHTRTPSEGVFSLSMDEESSLSFPSDAPSEFKAQHDVPTRRRIASAASTPLGSKRDFWASSKFQNSPSPDVLPVPAFKAQAAL